MRALRVLTRVGGAGLVLAALYPFYMALRALDRREFVSALLAVCIGWFVSQAGVELLRPDTAE
ncbi:MAG: hypothetical protein JNK72_19180 [Myxococcales bacterium]|nr:hypothetical protein [Myxococcales bacterium]